jgi:hypothetical protein
VQERLRVRISAGVISMEIAGDYRDKLEVVGDGVDAACLVSCLRRKLGHAEILQVEEVKDKPQEDEATKENTMTAHHLMTAGGRGAAAR